MLTESLLQTLLEKAAGAAPGYDVELIAATKREALTRFGNNVISQNVDTWDTELVVVVKKGPRLGRASCNQPGTEALARAARNAVRLAESQPDRPDLLPPLSRQTYRALNHFVPRTAKHTPKEKAEAIREVVSLCRKRRLNAAGIFSGGFQDVGLANTRGLSVCGTHTEASFSLTVMTPDSSGWAETTHRDIGEIDPEALAETAIQKALDSRKPRKAPPGRYTVVLEPHAVAELLLFMAWETFGALPYQEGRSFLSGAIGKSLMNESVTILDDVYHPKTIGLPFDFEGVPRRRVALIEKGVGRGVVYDRATARRDGVESTGHSLPQPNSFGPLPLNLVMASGSDSREDLIAGTERGLLVTHFHYTNLIDPVPLTLTGMTRNGTFLIEKGRVRHAVRNFRFTESVLEAFNRIEAVGRDQVYASSFWGSGIVAPALKIRDFNFSSSTTF
jgi:PmbA protein